MDKKSYPEVKKALQFINNEIDKITYYFIKEILEREIMSNINDKSIATFDCVAQTLLVFSTASGEFSITSFARKASTGISLGFSFGNGLAPKIKINEEKEKQAQQNSFTCKKKNLIS